MLPEQDALVIGSRFDTDESKVACRLAFYGRLAALIRAEDPAELARLRIFKPKKRVGSIDRVAPDGFSAVCKGMFQKDTNISLFSGMKVRLWAGIRPPCGMIQGSETSKQLAAWRARLRLSAQILWPSICTGSGL